MTEKQSALLKSAEMRADELFAVACDIYDRPELGREEVFASGKLTEYLERQGFAVERGVGGIETSYRAVWERGSGGPTIGFMMEYDALPGLGHACGHHLQAPVCIGAALALRDVCEKDFRLVLYGTPDEEGGGGKIDMLANGCFRDVDVMLCYHTGRRTFASCMNKAVAPLVVTYHGTPAHASGSPHLGRSALDALMLAFHGLEILREHVPDGCRIHYSILEGTGAANIVPPIAKAKILLRTGDGKYIDELAARAEKVLRGAADMTETTVEIEHKNVYRNYVPIPSLRKTALDFAEAVGAEDIDRSDIQGNGSTDIGNVSWVVPAMNFNTFFVDAASHSEENLRTGKTPQARTAMLFGSKILGCTAMELIENAALLSRIKEEHTKAVNG